MRKYVQCLRTDLSSLYCPLQVGDLGWTDSLCPVYPIEKDSQFRKLIPKLNGRMGQILESDEEESYKDRI
jgi:hypothetical protein